MRSSPPIPPVPPTSARVGLDKPTKTEMVAVRSRLVSDCGEEPDGDSEDRPTAMRDWTAPSTMVVERTRGTLIRMDATCAGMTLLLPDELQRFGRGREADVRVDDESVSRLHAAIRRTPEGYEISDLESRNGTVVSGRLVRRATLRDGDTIQLGPRVSFRFSLMSESHADVMRQLFETSVRDGLTGAFNRQHLDDRLHGELAYAVRHRSEIGLLLIDVDHFKRVNDTFGHPGGDEVLKFVAGMISSRLRTEDIFARYGGEEFVAVLRGIDLAGTARAGERLRHVLATNSTSHGGRTIPITVSVGGASLWTCTTPTIEALIATADRRLYVAKNSGRNRVVATDGDAAIKEAPSLPVPPG